MQVGIDITCIHANFSGRGLSSFGEIATFNNSQISLFDFIKKLNGLESDQKIHASRGDVICMHISLGQICRFWPFLFFFTFFFWTMYGP